MHHKNSQAGGQLNDEITIGYRIKAVLRNGGKI